MIVLWILFFVLIALYFSYPIWLMTFTEKPASKETQKIDQVTMVYLSFNGASYLKKKIKFLMEEGAAFKNYEIIIIDDHSSDGTEEVLDGLKSLPNVRIVRKYNSLGVAHSMNLASKLAHYDHLVFCDQRQFLQKGAIKDLVSQLEFEHIGAVSSCLSSKDKDNNLSLLRIHENYIKQYESKSGNLMGVYGPLYAIKKKFYFDIPSHIILDDLYLSLRVLRYSSVEFLNSCQIVDNNSYDLYNYSRSKRYLKGLIQLLFEKGLISQLSFQQKIMLIWHKYLRLSIPILFFIIYMIMAIQLFFSLQYLIPFLAISFVLAITVLLGVLKIRFNIPNFVQINMYYVIAFFHLILEKTLFVDGSIQNTTQSPSS